MEIKEIELNKIHPNPTQPREKFDRDKLRELSESILSNGLINPITVRVKGNGYEIISGERRWKAHQIADLDKIQVIVKEYRNEGDSMIASLIENIHREDLGEYEKAKFLKQIMKVKNISSERELAKLIKLSPRYVNNLLGLMSSGSTHISKAVENGEITEHHFRAIRTIGDKKTEKEVLEKVKKEDLSSAKTEKLASIIKQSTPQVKEALLKDEINVEQAERISKLKSESERERAIQEHKNIKRVDKEIERNIEKKVSTKDNKEFKKKLLQAGNWIASFRGSVSDSAKSLEKTIKVLLVSTKFISVMDERQKETLEQQLDRFLEIINRAKQLTEQIEERL